MESGYRGLRWSRRT